MKLTVVFTCFLLVVAARSQTLSLPPRPASAMAGSQFAESIKSLELQAREEKIFSEIMAGNVPEFLRKLCPVTVTNGDGGNTALWYAAQGPFSGGLAVAKVLVDAGAEVNRQCEHGRTALHMAAAWGHLDLVKYLLANSADPSIRDEENMTPAMVARHGYSSNRVTHDERRDVCLYFDSLEL